MMACHLPSIINKFEGDTTPITIQLPQSNGVYPASVSVRHDSDTFVIGSLGYNTSTGIGTFDLMPSSSVAPVRLMVSATYADGTVASWQWLTVNVTETDEFAYTAPRRFELELREALIFDFQGNLNFKYDYQSEQEFIFDSIGVLALLKALTGDTDLDLLAQGFLSAVYGLSDTETLEFDPIGIFAVLRIFNASSQDLTLDTTANLSVYVTIDAPIEGATMLALNQLAFGVERLVSTATTSMTLLRTSDSVQRTSSFNDINAFNIAEIATWAGGSTVELVDFIEQKAGIARLVPNTRPVVMTGGVWNARFGTSIDMTTATGGDLSRTGEGGCGVNINGIRFTLVGSGITTAEGLEVTTLVSSNTRKNQSSATVTADPKTSNSTNETIWRINSPSATNNGLDFQLASGNIMRVPRRFATVTESITAGGTPVLGTTIKQFATEVVTTGMTSTNLFSYAKGSFMALESNPTANSAQDALLANGTIIIGSGSATAQSSPANMVFGGIIITKTLTNNQRYLLQEKLQQVAHYHLRASTTELLALADEVIDMRDVNTSTGLVAGKKGKTAIQFSVGESTTPVACTYSQTGFTLTVTRATPHGLAVGQEPTLTGSSGTLVDGMYKIISVSPTVNPTSFTCTAPTSQNTSGNLTFNFSSDWNFAHTVADNGLQGVRSPIQARGSHNPAADYVATNNYFAQTTKKAVSVLTFNRIENTSNELRYWLGVADSTEESPAYLSHGRDHTGPSYESKVDPVIDTANYSNEQYGFVDNGGNQPMVKYSQKLCPSWNTPFTTTVAVTLATIYRFVITSGSVPIGTVLTNAWFKTNLGLDAPTPEFQKYGSTTFTYEQDINTLDLMISTHKPSDAWDGTSSNINIKRATNHLYIGNSGLFGHQDSSICRTESGNHYLSKSTSRIRRVRGGANTAANGTLLLWMFFDRELTATEAQKLNVNMYKWYA